MLKVMQSNSLVAGTLGGTFLSIAPVLSTDDIIKTVLLATVGAIVSFIVSVMMKCLLKKHMKK